MIIKSGAMAETLKSGYEAHFPLEVMGAGEQVCPQMGSYLNGF